MPSNQFYQKQAPTNRTGRGSRVTVIDSAGKRDQQQNPDEHADHFIRKNIKLFLIIVICMGTFLVLSIKYVEYQWGRRDQRIVSSYRSTLNDDAPAVLSTNIPIRRAQPSPTPAPSQPFTIDDEPTPQGTAEVETILRWGNILEEAGEFEGALDRYGEALLIDPGNLPVLIKAGRLNIRLSRYEEAVHVLSKARKESDGNPDILNDLGVALTFNGQMEEAVALYDELLLQYPDYVPALFNQGYALMQLQDFERALPLLEEYIKSKPGDTMALGVLAVLELNNQNHEKALDLLDQAIELDPAWAMPYLDAATICASIEEDDRAVNYLESALHVSPPADVYQRYQSSAFDNIRMTDKGKTFEKTIAEQAREMMKQ